MMAHHHDIGSIAEFPVGTSKLVEVRGRVIGVFNIEGDLHALPSVCPHQIGPLCEGKVSGTLLRNKKNWKLEWVEDGQIVTCPWHGLEFRIATGECLAYPHIKLRTYKVICRDERVVLEI